MGDTCAGDSSEEFMRKARAVVSRPHGLPKELLAKRFPKDSQVGVGRIICSQDVHIMGSICSCCPLAVTWFTVSAGFTCLMSSHGIPKVGTKIGGKRSKWEHNGNPSGNTRKC